jgi:hypothetical protein
MTTNQIIAILKIKDCGTRTTKIFVDYALKSYLQFITNNDLMNFINECGAKNIIEM